MPKFPMPGENRGSNETQRMKANEYSADDIARSRIEPNLMPPESGRDQLKVVEQLLHEVDEFLAEHEVRSKDELQFLLQKIDTAIAINNDPKAKEIRADLIRKFGDDAKA